MKALQYIQVSIKKKKVYIANFHPYHRSLISRLQVLQNLIENNRETESSGNTLNIEDMNGNKRAK